MRRLISQLILVCAVLTVASAQGVITTVAGTDSVFLGDGVRALQAKLSGSLGLGVATDTSGNVYIADALNHVVFKVTPSGILSRIAGNGIGSFSGDGGPARSASLNFPQAVVVDSAGNVYVADTGNNCVRKITPGGIISTIAGNGLQKYAGDGGPAISASISFPETLTIDTAENVYVGSTEDGRIRKITPTGIITTVAGNGTTGFSGDGGPGTAAQFDFPSGLAVDKTGNLYISDSANARIRRVSPSGVITTVAGGGEALTLKEVPAASAAIYPVGLAFDPAGTLYFGDLLSNRVAKITTAGTIVTVAGNGVDAGTGDDGPAISASISYPISIAFDPAGNMFIADQNLSVIRKVNPAGTITRFAGDGAARFAGDGGPATLAVFNFPDAVAVGPDGRLYIADRINNRVRTVEKDGTVQTIAGNGDSIPSGDGGDARKAGVPQPAGIAFDKSGNTYITEVITGHVRKIDPGGNISTVAGTGLGGFSGDGGPATRASLQSPTAIAVDAAGNIYVADAGNDRIRRIDTRGIIATVAGGGASLDEGIPPTRAALKLHQRPDTGGGLAFDGGGNLYISDTFNHRVRKLTPNGTITTVAGNGKPGYSGDNGAAINASLNTPVGLAVDSNGNLLITDQQNNRIRIVAGGNITTIAGDGVKAFRGDGGPPLAASFRAPSDVAVDTAGNIFIDDRYNNRIRQILVTPPGFNVSATSLAFTGTRGGAQSSPQLFAVTSQIPGLLFSVNVTTASGGSWLIVNPSAGASPGIVEVSANPANLAAGTYQGTITITSPNASPRTRTISVTLTVTPGAPPSLSLDKASISFTFPKSAKPRSDVITVRNSGAGTLDFNAVAATSSGGNWLRISPASGQVSPISPAVLAVTADPTGLAPGTYSGQVTISAPNGDSRVVSITMTISDAEKALLLTQTGLSFSAVAGGGVIPSQTFGVLNVGSGSIQWSVSSSTLSGGPNWLSTTPRSGTTDAGNVTPVVDVQVNPSGLPAGSYYGLVRVDYTGDDPRQAANSPQVLTVSLEVMPAGSNPAPVLDPTELTFIGVQGGDIPASKEIVIYNSSASPKTFRSVISTGPDAFSVSAPPRDGTVLPGEPLHVIVQPRTDNATASGDRSVLSLPAGVYNRDLSFQFSDGSVKTVKIKLIAAPAGSQVSNRFRPHAVGCAPTKLFPSITSLSQAFAVSAGWPVALSVEVQDDCGTPLDDGFVSVSFSNGDAPILLQSLKQGRWQGSWSARNSSSSQVTLKVEAVNPQIPLSGTREISGDLRSGQDAPFTDKNGIVSAATFKPFVPVAPAGMITIFGERLSEGTAQAQALPLPTNLAGTEIVMAGVQLPLLYVSQNQVNAVVPAGINTNTSQQLLIRRGNTLSRPIALDVAAAQPGIFVTGDGKPIVVNASAPGSAPVLVNDSPAGSGDVLVLYSSGLGLTTPLIADGAASPSSPVAATKDNVSVTIGGVPTQVLFAGLVPGFAAFYQINVAVPSGLPAGDQLPVVVSVSGQTSPALMMRVRH